MGHFLHPQKEALTRDEKKSLMRIENGPPSDCRLGAIVRGATISIYDRGI